MNNRGTKCICGESCNFTTTLDVGFDTFTRKDGVVVEERQHLNTCNKCGATRIQNYQIIPNHAPVTLWSDWIKDNLSPAFF